MQCVLSEDLPHDAGSESFRRLQLAARSWFFISLAEDILSVSKTTH